MVRTEGGRCFLSLDMRVGNREGKNAKKGRKSTNRQRTAEDALSPEGKES